MDKLSWVKELVKIEQQMEESGMVDFSVGFDPQKHLFEESLQFLEDLKVSFVDVATAFNQLKTTQLGRIKIYGISNTHADFMLFRNGFKLIFAMKEPGIIAIRFQYAGAQFSGTTAQVSQTEEDLLYAKWGAFGDLQWTFQDQPVKLDYLVKYYMSRFAKESAK